MYSPYLSLSTIKNTQVSETSYPQASHNTDTSSFLITPVSPLLAFSFSEHRYGDTNTPFSYLSRSSHLIRCNRVIQNLRSLFLNFLLPPPVTLTLSVITKKSHDPGVGESLTSSSFCFWSLHLQLQLLVSHNTDTPIHIFPLTLALCAIINNFPNFVLPLSTLALALSAISNTRVPY